MKIGWRIIKTCIAVFICLLIGTWRGNPFYAVIATVLCMQNDHKNGFEQGFNRMAGTFVGGFFGMIGLFFFQYMNIEFLSLAYDVIICLSVIPIIKVTLWMKMPKSSYIACVVFFSIVISHVQDVSPAGFALDRVVDTLLGIVVALAVNACLPGGKNEK